MTRLILIYSIWVLTGCASGKKRPVLCNDVYQPSILSDRPYEDDDLISDSMQKRIWIIFEQNFDDSISVFVNRKYFKGERIITDKVMGVCSNSVQIDYSAYKNEPLISFVLLKSNKCVSFYPLYGKRMAYINYIEDAWSIEISNILRKYR